MSVLLHVVVVIIISSSSSSSDGSRSTSSGNNSCGGGNVFSLFDIRLNSLMKPSQSLKLQVIWRGWRVIWCINSPLGDLTSSQEDTLLNFLYLDVSTDFADLVFHLFLDKTRDSFNQQ